MKQPNTTPPMQKKKHASYRYRKMRGFLDENGFVVNIQRIHNKRYEYIVNWKIEKVYKQRRSCNKRLEKLYNQISNNE